MMSATGFIGVGHLAVYLLNGLARSGVKASDIILSPRGKGACLSRKHGYRLAADNADLVRQSAIVVLAVRPQQAEPALEGLPWRPGQLVVSVCAGIPLERLSPAAAPAKVVRAMPITAVQVGASPTAIYPDDERVRALFAPLGGIVPLVREDDFDVATIYAAVYGWVHALIGAAADWGEANGLARETARNLSARTFLAAARMVEDEAKEPVSALVERLSTPGGITEAGMNHLYGAGVPELWKDACAVSLAHLRTLRGG